MSAPRILVIVAHPDLSASRINSALMAVASREAVTPHDLYATYPDFRIDAAAEQRMLDQHDVVVLQYPFRWYSVPPLLKLWLDEVLAYGYAYGRKGTALHGKVLQLAVSTGRMADEYHRDGDAGYTMTELLYPMTVTARLCGMIFSEPFLVHGGTSVDDAALASHAERYRKLLANL